jgi:hypothetical protein
MILTPCEGRPEAFAGRRCPRSVAKAYARQRVARQVLTESTLPSVNSKASAGYSGVTSYRSRSRAPLSLARPPTGPPSIEVA